MPVSDLLDHVIQSWNIHRKCEWHFPLTAQIFFLKKLRQEAFSFACLQSPRQVPQFYRFS